MIGKQIKYYRQKKQVKQNELAKYLGVSFQAVSKWETGASTPDISLLPKLAMYFGISIDELFEMPYEGQMERIENMFQHESCINDKTFDKAVLFLNSVIKDNPKDTRALSNLAYLYNHRANSDHELASYYAEKVLEYDPDNKSGWVAYLEANNGLCGDECFENHFKVISFFKDYIEKNPLHFRGLYALMENLIADNRFDEAVVYNEQMKKVANNHLYLLYSGDIAFGKGDRNTARVKWEQMTKDYPDEWQAFCDLGDGYLKLGEIDNALKAYEKSYSMQESPHIYDGLCSIAQIYEMQGKNKEAINTYNRIIYCLKQDYNVIDGDQVERYKREINRLKKQGELIFETSRQMARNH